MRKLSRERRRLAAVAGASAAISTSSLLLFSRLPHSASSDALYGLMVGIPLGVTLMMFLRLKRSKEC